MMLTKKTASRAALVDRPSRRPGTPISAIPAGARYPHDRNRIQIPGRGIADIGGDSRCPLNGIEGEPSLSSRHADGDLASVRSRPVSNIETCVLAAIGKFKTSPRAFDTTHLPPP